MAATEKKGRLLPTVTEVNVAATMRDGIVLRADVYHPPQDGRYPVLLCRTPYDKTREGYVEAGQRMAERGYTVVVQDVRGRHASEGEFRPGLYSAEHDDAEDGYDAVEWAAQLPSSTGAVGTFGGSYDGWTQWELAHARPPHLKAMISSAIAANLLDRELGGVLRLGRVLEWTINGLSLDAGRRRGVPFLPVSGEEARRLWVERDRHKWLWHPAPAGDSGPDHARHGQTLAPVAGRSRHRPLPLPGKAPGDRCARPHDHRLVRPADRHHQAFYGHGEKRQERARPTEPAAHHRPLDAHADGSGAKGGTGGLWSSGTARLLRNRRPVVHPLAQRCAKRRPKRRRRAAADRGLRHGLQSMAA